MTCRFRMDDSRDDLRQIKTGADDFGLMTHDPAFMNTATQSAITYIDGDKDPALSRLPDQRSPRRQLSRNGAPDPLRRAADGVPDPVVDARHHAHDAPREHQEADGGVSVHAPDGHLPEHRRRDVGFYPDAKNIFDKGAMQDASAHRQGAEHRSVGVPPQHRPSRTSIRQRSELHCQLPEHAVQDDGAEVSNQSHSRKRSTSCSSCTPITSRTARPRRCGRSAARMRPALSLAGAAHLRSLHGGANEAVLRMLNEIGSVAKIPSSSSE